MTLSPASSSAGVADGHTRLGMFVSNLGALRTSLDRPATNKPYPVRRGAVTQDTDKDDR